MHRTVARGLLAVLIASAAFGLGRHPARAQSSPIWMLAQSLRARAQPGPAPAPSAGLGTPGSWCRAAIAAAEQAYHLPPHLLGAIGVVESGRRGSDGRIDPWPWSINVAGVDHVYDSKAEVVAAVRALQEGGARSIDTGCLQVNLMYHPDAFASLEEAFDPMRNADYAARMLVQLHAQTGSWETATAWYHSASPVLGPDYQRKVAAQLASEQSQPAPVAQAAFAPAPRAVSLLPPGGAPFGSLTRPTMGRVLLTAANGTGRGLAAYRLAPVMLAGRVFTR